MFCHSSDTYRAQPSLWQGTQQFNLFVRRVQASASGINCRSSCVEIERRPGRGWNGDGTGKETGRGRGREGDGTGTGRDGRPSQLQGLQSPRRRAVVCACQTTPFTREPSKNRPSHFDGAPASHRRMQSNSTLRHKQGRFPAVRRRDECLLWHVSPLSCESPRPTPPRAVRPGLARSNAKYLTGRRR